MIQVIITFVPKFKDNRHILKIKVSFEAEFIAKLIFTVYYRINKWLDQCGGVYILTDMGVVIMDMGGYSNSS